MRLYVCLLGSAWLTCLTPATYAADHVAKKPIAAALIAEEPVADDQIADHAALVKTVAGVVRVTRQQHTLVATSGTTLQVSDRIVTASGGTAAIVFRDGTLLTLGSDADILVRDYVFAPKDNKFAFSVYLTKGSAIYESGKIGKLSPQSVVVQTPKATVGVRGTRFLIEVN